MTKSVLVLCIMAESTLCARSEKPCLFACVKDKKLHCKGRIKTTLKHTLVSQIPHSYVPNTVKVDVKMAPTSCRKRTREEVSIPVYIHHIQGRILCKKRERRIGSWSLSTYLRKFWNYQTKFQAWDMLSAPSTTRASFKHSLSFVVCTTSFMRAPKYRTCRTNQPPDHRDWKMGNVRHI